MYETTIEIAAKRTLKRAGCFPAAFCAGVSDSQVWTAKDIDAHAIVRLRKNIAAIGSVEAIVELISVEVSGLGGGGAWYGTMRSGRLISFLFDIVYA